MPWVSLGSQFRRGLRRGEQAMERLAQAYVHVFRGNPTKEDQEIVLADLHNESGFSKVFVPGPRVNLNFEEGKRYTYGRIHRFLAMGNDEWRELQEAARREAMADAEEQPII